jgi:hypothetical protein
MDIEEGDAFSNATNDVAHDGFLSDTEAEELDYLMQLTPTTAPLPEDPPLSQISSAAAMSQDTMVYGNLFDNIVQADDDQPLADVDANNEITENELFVVEGEHVMDVATKSDEEDLIEIYEDTEEDVFEQPADDTPGADPHGTHAQTKESSEDDPIEIFEDMEEGVTEQPANDTPGTDPHDAWWKESEKDDPIGFAV